MASKAKAVTTNELSKILNSLRGEFAIFRDGVNSRFDRIDARFTKDDDRFTKIEDRFTKIDDRFTKIDDRFTKIDDRFTKVDDHFAKIDARFTKMAVAIDDCVKKSEFREAFGTLNSKFDRMLAMMDKMAGELFDNRQSHIVFGAMFGDHRRTLESHGQRLSVLEGRSAPPAP